MAKYLILRFSSIGDVLQCLSVAGAILDSDPSAEIHWVTREDMKPLIQGHPAVKKVWSLSKGQGFKSMRDLARDLRAENFDFIYDAHNNLRSHVLSFLLNGLFSWRRLFSKTRFLRRSQKRWKRFFLFRFGWNLYPKPFSGQRALLEPLAKWGLSVQAPAAPQLFLNPQVFESLRLKVGAWNLENSLALAPSAAYPLKRWPLTHWKALIEEMPQQKFVVLGGPGDNFLSELVAVDPSRVLNLAGHLSLLESAAVVSLSQALVANDTGLLHVAEQLGKTCVALMGPAPFGFPSRPKTKILEIDLPCRPCSKHGQGPCVNKEFQKCLVDIRPQEVVKALKGI